MDRPNEVLHFTRQGFVSLLATRTMTDRAPYFEDAPKSPGSAGVVAVKYCHNVEEHLTGQDRTQCSLSVSDETLPSDAEIRRRGRWVEVPSDATADEQTSDSGVVKQMQAIGQLVHTSVEDGPVVAEVFMRFETQQAVGTTRAAAWL